LKLQQRTSTQGWLWRIRKDTRKLQCNSNPLPSFGNSERSDAKDQGYPGPAHGYKLKSAVRGLKTNRNLVHQTTWKESGVCKAERVRGRGLPVLQREKLNYFSQVHIQHQHCLPNHSFTAYFACSLKTTRKITAGSRVVWAGQHDPSQKERSRESVDLYLVTQQGWI
jgi:hypothetical protein